MSGRSSQRKGRTAEIELSRILNEHGFHTRPGAPVSFGGTPDLEGLEGIHCEIKRRENLNVPAALRQAAVDAEYFSGGEDIPVVFVRGNREAWRVVMSLESFIRLYRHTDFFPAHSITRNTQ